MNKSQLQVKEFSETFGVPVRDLPQVSIDHVRALLRGTLIHEEFKETIAAMGLFEEDGISIHNSREFNLVEVVDGLCDLIYVINGAALEFGIDLEPYLDEVHRSNMSKMWSPEEWGESIASGRVEKEGLTCVDTSKEGANVGEKCLVVKRQDFKIIKSPSYSPANIRGILDKEMCK